MRPETGNRLKSAVLSVAVPPYLDARIRNRIRSEQQPRRWLFRPGLSQMAAAGIAAVVCISIATAYSQGHFRFTKASQISYVWSVTNQLVSLMRPGLADHIHCSVFRKYPENAPPVEVLAQKLPAQYRQLIPIVQSQVPSDYRLLVSHQCRWDGRRFIHLSLGNPSHVLSVVIARRTDGESFQANGLLPALVQSGIPMYQAEAQRFAVTAFETKESLVYFVSDLPQGENTRILEAMAPDMKNLLDKLRS